MNLNFSDRMSNIKASEIRELLKLTEQPEIISFAGGLPAPELFPKEKIGEIAKEVLFNEGAFALQYTTTEGFAPLRKIIVEERMAPSGVKCDISNIMLTNGSQQGLEFSAKLFVNKGDVIICESPSYLGAINAFKAYEPKFIEISMDKDGMIIEELEKAIKENDNVKMIYTIPDFQNPSGITMSLERRKRLAALAAKYEIPVIEDSPYGELRYDNEKLREVGRYRLVHITVTGLHHPLREPYVPLSEYTALLLFVRKNSLSTFTCVYESRDDDNESIQQEFYVVSLSLPFPNA